MKEGGRSHMTEAIWLVKLVYTTGEGGRAATAPTEWLYEQSHNGHTKFVLVEMSFRDSPSIEQV